MSHHRRLFRLLAGSSAAGLFLVTAGPALACFTPPPPCPGLTITTKAASGTVGQPIHDVATLSGGNKVSGSITWTVYGASDRWCSNPLHTTASVSVNGDGNYTSPDYTPASAGSYQWVAEYSAGDRDRDNDISTKCNDASEVSTVSKAIASLSTNATASTTVGQAIGDSAVLSGGDSPSGTITWSVYAAGTSCVAPLFTTGAVAVNGDGTYSSPSYTPTATGTYQWVATYSGDSNNSAFTSSCSDTSEQSAVRAAPSSPPPTSSSPPPSNKKTVRSTKVLRCGPGKVKKHKTLHGKSVTVCVAKKKRAIVTKRPLPSFTG